MPYLNPYYAEHSARQQPPSRFKAFRRKVILSRSTQKPIVLVIGSRSGRPSARDTEVQSLRFPVEYWTAAQALRWLAAHDDEFTAKNFEPAVKQSQKTRRNPLVEIDPEELEMGVLEELEHTDDMDEAEQIARDHLSRDPRYYSKMMECGLIQTR